MNRRAALGALGAVGALGVLGGGIWWAERSGGCARLTRRDLDESIALGGRYLVASQRPEGDFVYEVDWTSEKESPGNNVVRQAGATWGLSLWHRELCERGEPAEEARAALDKALTFWRSLRRSDEQGRSWLSYPADPRGQMGTIALIGLALVDRLSSPQGLSDETQADWKTWLNELLAFARSGRRPGGGFSDRYHLETGRTLPSSNPYVDGEVLLLFAKAGLQLGLPGCVDEARAWAPVDYERNVTAPRAKEPDPDTTKGYYQWGSMSWYQLARAGHDAEQVGAWLLELAHWMIDIHRTLERTRNTAYAYEGILSAYDWARQTGDRSSASKFACTAHQGMSKLFSWQIGHPLALPELASASERFVGGVQNAKDETVLRIDVAQHQLHASILARRFELV